jgi:hypothetical protein
MRDLHEWLAEFTSGAIRTQERLNAGAAEDRQRFEQLVREWPPEDRDLLRPLAPDAFVVRSYSVECRVEVATSTSGGGRIALRALNLLYTKSHGVSHERHTRLRIEVEQVPLAGKELTDGG